KEKGGIGFLFWNAGNDYSKPFAAMPQMRADAPRYFRDAQLLPPGYKVEPPQQPSAMPGGTPTASSKSAEPPKISSVEPAK
ncbi:MAG: hypothetical protein L0Z53_12965, partial [Acidobacteriales bacterium]|nr:hypothetical protein [Terriglobales bacterium]